LWLLEVGVVVVVKVAAVVLEATVNLLGKL
jgi:hypothetical protein